MFHMKRNISYLKRRKVTPRQEKSMKLGGLLKSLAPTIASAAGGPMAGMAVKMAASKPGS